MGRGPAGSVAVAGAFAIYGADRTEPALQHVGGWPEELGAPAPVSGGAGAASILFRVIGGHRHSVTTEIVAEHQPQHIDPRIIIVESRIGYVLVSKQEAGFPLPVKVGAKSEVAGEKEFAPKILPFET